MSTQSPFTSETAGLPPVDPDSIQFLLFTDEDIKKLSVAKITNTNSFDSLGNACKGGVYDLRLGPTRDRQEVCGTCSNYMLHCPGHFGHIDLPLVVVNPLFIKNIYTLFRVSCLTCFKIQMTDPMKYILNIQLQLVDAGHVTAALELDQFAMEISDGHVENCGKILKKYQKILKKSDPITEVFRNKNVDKIRTKILTNYLKKVNIAKKCLYCSTRLIKITTSEGKLMYNTVENGQKGVKILLPDEIQQFCNSISDNDEDILKLCFPILGKVNTKPVTNAFFLKVIAVLPSNTRPCNFLRGELVEHPQSQVYKNILNLSLVIIVILQVITAEDPEKVISNLEQAHRSAYETTAGPKSPSEKLHFAWQELQKQVNYLLDNQTKQGRGGSDNDGLKQILEKKTGLIRMHMMGKRVNFAARSVITPDPNVDVDEIGIPDAFATKLTYPVPVTEWNVDELRKMIINGPNVHPGAEKVELESGSVIRLPPDSIQKRKSIAKRLLTPDEIKNSGLKIVHRHLINGDVLILNRQPSLHKPSMMAHRARVLKGEKTLRLHYANCKSYNADFDGDEMNAHFPQNEIARSEAYNVMSVRKQYLVPKDGTPLSGLIQDHVISGVKMSLRGAFFSKSDYQQLVFQALGNHKGKVKLLPPTILKPVTLWSGKQILSTIIINLIPKGKPCLSLTGNAKISSKAWQLAKPRPWKAGGTPFNNPNTMTEAEVVIRKGELLSGVLDKTHYGATPYGLVHCMYELYGGYSSSALLSSFSKLFTFYLQWIGFTLGVKDILVVEEANKKRDEYISLVRNAGRLAAIKATELPTEVDDKQLKDTIGEMHAKDPKFRANLDRQYKSVLDSYTNNINTACLSEGLLEKFPDNNLQLMVQSGAKGSTVNTMQISCLLGQIELEGKRPPLMISGRSLPSFPPYDVSPRAGGFIDGRFMTGIQPQEFFFHCMAGREGLIDTAVKTSRSGYLQRCLIKHLESLCVSYDQTVRDADGGVVQFFYGEDGLDVLKCQYLNEKQLSFLDLNSNAILGKNVLKKLKENSETKTIEKAQKSLKKWKKKNGNPLDRSRAGGFVRFSATTKNDVEPRQPQKNGIIRDPLYWELEENWRSMDEEERQQYQLKRCPDPVPHKVAPEFKFGAINERMDEVIHNYLKKRQASIFNEITERDKFVEIMSAKYLESMAEPGEPVGLLAAQSIGEPSTQMTLNTFHFAGRGDMNVTLGIPRLREILMTASANLKTPNMDIPFRADVSNINKKAEKLRQRLNRVTVSDVLEKIDVDCEIVTKPDRQLKTTIRFIFLPYSQFKMQYYVKPKRIIKHMENNFFNEMFNVIRRHAKAVGGVALSTDSRKRKSQLNKGDDDDDDGDEPEKAAATRKDDLDSSDDEAPNEDDDQTAAKIRGKRTEDQEYEDPESGEEEKSDDEDVLPENDANESDDENKAEDTTVNEAEISRMITDHHKEATNYSVDMKNHQWCEITVNFPISFLRVDLSQALREAATKSVLHEIKNIKRAITNTDNDVLYIKTDGINILQMFKYNDILDLNRLYSNDIHAIARTYGIEAANKVVIKEIQNVFNVYGITVDPRHLSLVADYMTFNGVFEPMSKRGMESSASPLQQMSFESTLLFLKDAVLNAKTDNLRSATSSLIVGQPCRSGTGSFVLQHYNKALK